MQQNRTTLAEGDIAVWGNTEDNQTVIHHNAGLTIALNDREEEALLEWLQADIARKQDIKGLQKLIELCKQSPAVGWKDSSSLNYAIDRLKNDYGIIAIVDADKSIPVQYATVEG